MKQLKPLHLRSETKEETFGYLPSNLAIYNPFPPIISNWVVKWSNPCFSWNKRNSQIMITTAIPYVCVSVHDNDMAMPSNR